MWRRLGFEVQHLSPSGHQPPKANSLSIMICQSQTLTVPVSRISITMGYNRFFSQPDAFFLLSDRKWESHQNASALVLKSSWSRNILITWFKDEFNPTVTCMECSGPHLLILTIHSKTFKAVYLHSLISHNNKSGLRNTTEFIPRSAFCQNVWTCGGHCASLFPNQMKPLRFASFVYCLF